MCEAIGPEKTTDITITPLLYFILPFWEFRNTTGFDFYSIAFLMQKLHLFIISTIIIYITPCPFYWANQPKKFAPNFDFTFTKIGNPFRHELYAMVA